MAFRHGHRKIGYQRARSAAALALAMLCGARIVEAADAPQNWRVECDSTAKTLDCRLVQEAFTTQNHQLLAAMVIRVPAETKKPVMLIQLPLGILVSAAVGVQVENHAAATFAIQTCTTAGCFVGAPLPDDLLAAMRTGKQMQISYLGTDKHDVLVTLPLTGFALAYDKIK